MSKKNNLYLGKAGELTAMSYFLMRGWNVATPEVDVGDDIFVIEDNKGIFHRVQVKTAKATERKNGYSAQFNLPLSQLRKRIQPEIHYIFIVCRNEEWSDKIIIPRRKLFILYQKHSLGTVYEDVTLTLYFSFKEGKVFCSDVDITEFKNNFSNFATIQH
jgi:hypothetical protein